MNLSALALMLRLYPLTRDKHTSARTPPQSKLTTSKPNERKVMKNTIRNIALFVLPAMAAFSALTIRGAEDLPNDCQQAVANFQGADSSLKTFIDNSAGYAVFPNVGKGGLIVGGAHGKGLLYEKGKITGQTSMTQAGIGAQAGGQTFAEIICFENPGAVSDFKACKFELGADVSAVAASEGASKSAKYKK